MRIPPSFLENSEKKGFSKKHRKTIKFNIGKYDAKVIEGKKQFADLARARKLAKNIKWHSLANLPRLILQFEQHFTARGGKVIWAENTEEAQVAVQKILEAKQAKLVVKSKSMITEEIELNAFLEKKGVQVVETDLGEFIVQLRDEPPYHIVTPAMHLSKEDIAQLFNEKYGTPADSTPESITAFVRKELRILFQQAEVGISGGNFLVADTGSVVLVTNEGNARMASTFPDTHIAIVGIEKVIPSLNHLDLFLPLLATYGTGQDLTVYNTILNGPRQPHEHDGPSEMYVILLDNGRTEILADPQKRQSLYCIRCGSCLNACPVYKTIGGHTYDSPYSGPIGAVLSPHLHIGEFEDYVYLSHASSLCGKCTESCPVNIDIHQMLLNNRHEEAVWNTQSSSEKRAWKAWRSVSLSRRKMNAPAFAKNMTANLFLKKMWGKRREFPKFPSKTFNQLWKKGKV